MLVIVLECSDKLQAPRNRALRNSLSILSGTASCHAVSVPEGSSQLPILVDHPQGPGVAPQSFVHALGFLGIGGGGWHGRHCGCATGAAIQGDMWWTLLPLIVKGP